MRRPIACAALLVLASVAACGTQPASPNARRVVVRTNPGLPAAANPESVVDATGQVACSTAKLPARDHDAAVRVRLGGATATLTGRVTGDRWMPVLRNPGLTLTTGAGTVTTALKPAPMGPGDATPYGVVTVGLDRPVSGYVCLARFGAGPPAALTATSGYAAHCCTTLQLLQPFGGRLELDTGNVGVSLRIVDGQVLLSTGDDAFSYAFADFADSCWPLQLLRPGTAGLEDVTTRHPQALTADARGAWHYAQQRDISLGYYACWAADEDRLGHDAQVWETLAGLERQGKLRLPRDLTGPGWWKDGAAYVAQLRSFLTQNGYRTG